MERASLALSASGVAGAGLKAVALADAAVSACGVVDLTRAAVAATGRALEASGRAAESTGALELGQRLTQASAATLAPVFSASEAAFAASVGATVTAVDRAVDLTLSGTRKAVELGGRAADAALPLAVNLNGCAPWRCVAGGAAAGRGTPRKPNALTLSSPLGSGRTSRT